MRTVCDAYHKEFESHQRSILDTSETCPAFRVLHFETRAKKRAQRNRQVSKEDNLFYLGSPSVEGPS